MLNSCAFMGRLVKDPELRYTGNNVPVTTFTLAVERDIGEKQTDFIDFVAWRQTAEFITKYFVKGKMMAVLGSLQSRKWQDKNGNNRINWEVIVDSVYFCGKDETSHAVSAEDYVDEESGELPF